LKKILAISLLLLLAIACSTSFASNDTPTQPQVVDQQESPTEDQKVQSTPTFTNIPPTPTSTATLVPTPTLIPLPECVEPQPHAPLAEFEFSAYPQAVLGYLNTGASLADLAADLQALGIGNHPVAFQQADMNGDGAADLMVALVDPQMEGYVSRGSLSIYICQDRQYVMSYSELSQEPNNAPEIIHVRDLNDDGAVDVIVSQSSCGAHTCFEDVRILSWNGAGMINRVQGSTIEIPFPNVQITDYDRDRIYDLEVVGMGFGSAGAGPQREVTETWKYDQASGLWFSTGRAGAASNYRIHMVHDADDAMKRGEFQVAILLFEEAYNDPALLDWGDPVSEQLTIGGYARFKTVVAHAMLGDIALAREFLNQMKAFFPQNVPQFAYVQMAEIFLNSFESSGQQAACIAVQDYANQNAEIVLRPLGPAVFGYANREYTAVDMCP
jgi:hypothetical protein